MKASNNKLYGTTVLGGAYDNGVLFEYDPVSDEYTIMHEYTSFREHPWFSALLEIESDYGINDMNYSDLKFNIYPNPASNQLNLTSRISKGEVHLRILDVSGRKVNEFSAEQFEDGIFNYVIDLQNFKSGVYFLDIITDKNKGTQKFVVK